MVKIVTETAGIIKKFGKSATDSGSSSVQIALLTKRVNELTEHFKSHPKDNHSRRGLLKLVGQRKRMLSYLQKRNENEYKKLIEDLGLRK